jgi:hypothetical protein
MDPGIISNNQEKLNLTMNSELGGKLFNIENTCASIITSEANKENHNILSPAHLQIFSETKYNQVNEDEDDEWLHILAE